MSRTVIELKDLHYSFHDGETMNKVLHGISAAFTEGKITLLMGPSGAGKTTLLKLIGGLRTLQDGEITIDGTALSAASKRELVQLRRGIGFIFQAHHLIASLTVEQNVMMPLSFVPEMSGRKARGLARDILAEVGLKGHETKRPAQLSGGMKQRVAVARALVHRPKLILADEPTASLDSKTGHEIVELLAGLSRDQGNSIVLVTHDPRIRDIADHIYTLEDGQISAA